MRIIQTTNLNQTFRIFKIANSSLTYRRAQADKGKDAGENNQQSPAHDEESIEILKQSAIDFCQKNRNSNIACEAVFSLLYNKGIPLFLDNMTEEQIKNTADHWASDIISKSINMIPNHGSEEGKKEYQTLIAEIQIAEISRTKNTSNNIIIDLISNQLNLIKKAIDSLTENRKQALTQASQSLSSTQPVFSQDAILKSLENIQQNILTQAEPQLKLKVQTSKIKEWFVKASQDDKANFAATFYDDVLIAAGVYAKNRAGREDITQEVVAVAAKSLNIVLKQINEDSFNGIDEKTMQKNVLEKLSQSQLDKNWSNWRNEIVEARIAKKKSPLALLVKWFGNVADDRLWLTPQQIIRIRLEFFNTVANQIQTQITNAENTACASSPSNTHQPCLGYPKLLANIHDINFFSNPGNVAACFDDKSGKKWFSPGSIYLAKMTIKQCTSFHQDVIIDDEMIKRIVNALIQNVARWGSFKIGATKQTLFDMRGVPEEQQQTVDQSQPANQTQQNQQNPPPDQAKETDVSVWANPEAILFASQILMILTQGATENRYR